MSRLFKSWQSETLKVLMDLNTKMAFILERLHGGRDVCTPDELVDIANLTIRKSDLTTYLMLAIDDLMPTIPLSQEVQYMKDLVDRFEDFKDTGLADIQDLENIHTKLDELATQIMTFIPVRIPK